MRCCGEERTTMFCPMCGKKLSLGPFGEMLDYVKRQIATAQKYIEKHADAQHGFRVRQRETFRKRLAKLERWRAAITGVLEREIAREPDKQTDKEPDKEDGK